jgi:MYXO-CTERM domain-containing protein
MKLRTSVSVVAVAALALSCAPAAHASISNIDWLQMGPPAFGSPIPSGSVYNLPGLGNVTVTHSIPSVFFHARGNNPLLTSGSVVSGPDTYTWGNWEQIGATLQSGPDPLVPVPWRVTFSWANPVPANSIYVGVAGLGRTTSFGGGMTTATVNQNGTFLGDYTGGGNYGLNQFTSGPGTWTLNNSVTGAGGADPWWNTALGVVQINDAGLTSITVDFSHIRGDGAGVNIGFVPTPSAAALLGVGALVATRRRR